MNDAPSSAAAAPTPDPDAAPVPLRVYAPSQVGMGALLGGPVAMIYFLWANFMTLNRLAAARRTLAWGLIGFAALVLLIMRLPDGTPSFIFTLGYVVLGWQLAEQLQVPRQALDGSDAYARPSNWRVAGIGLLCALLSLVLAVIVVFVFTLLGTVMT